MNINLKATGITLTEAITDYATKKIQTLEKFIDKKHQGVVCRVEVGKTSNHHRAGEIFKAEVHINGAGLEIYAIAEAEDLYSAIDQVEDQTARELINTKSRRMRLLRHSQRTVKNMIKGFPWALKRLKKDSE